MFPHKERSRQHLSFSYFIKKRFSYTGRKLEKAAYFLKTGEVELQERNQKEKKRNQKEVSAQELQAELHRSNAMGSAFEKRSMSSGILGQRW